MEAAEAPPEAASRELPVATPRELPTAPLVLYDGNCGLCARSVRWILDHERDHDIVFAPLQGPTAALARERYPRIPLSIDTVVYTDSSTQRILSSQAPYNDPAAISGDYIAYSVQHLMEIQVESERRAAGSPPAAGVAKPPPLTSRPG